MRPRQYVYFAVKSELTSADEISARPGLQPDEARVRGARRSDPPVPVSHSWAIACREPEVSVDEQLDVDEYGRC